jgi:hypothetical protein
MSKHLNDVVHDAEDAVNEQKHRAQADLEKVKRDVLGDEMTTSEKLGSHANELKHRSQAEIDKAKRAVRDHT